jgi:hypothetical protein
VVNFAELAKDLVYTTLSQGADRLYTLDNVLADHQLTNSELAELLNSEELKRAVRKEATRAGKLGTRAGYIYRAENMVSALAEELFNRLRDPEAPVQEVIKGFVAIARTAGMEAPPVDKTSQTSTLNVQINVPRLATSTKLRYLEAQTLDA